MSKKKWQMIRVDRDTWNLLRKLRDKIQDNETSGTVVSLYHVVQIAAGYYDRLTRHDQEVCVIAKTDFDRLNRDQAAANAQMATMQIGADLQSLAIQWLLNNAQPLDGAGGDKWRVETLERARKYAGAELLKAYQGADEEKLQIVESLVDLAAQEMRAVADQAAIKQKVLQ
ncbi:MAG: hypothetical protein OXE85_05085 [Roseovarius sp.]|nr:hypothetical protein [Roseovarius sp.]